MSEKRKNDHLDLAKRSQVSNKIDGLYYEPFLNKHPCQNENISQDFFDFSFDAPIWFSSMTGGAARAKTINQNLAKISQKYGLGMGLGSCRALLESKDRLSDFDVKEFCPDRPLYTNIGIAQLIKIINDNAYTKLQKLQDTLCADGLIIHVNPLQEYRQPEGDLIDMVPLDALQLLIKETDIPIAVKEVGQGFGPKSMQKLCELPLKFIEFASLGGTNFTLLEDHRHTASEWGKTSCSYIGHTKEEMVEFANQCDLEQKPCFIISGGLKNTVEGYALQKKLNSHSLLGFGSALLKYAQDIQSLDEFIHRQIEDYKVTRAFCK